MNNLVIDHTITKTEEGTYYTIPFAVPEGIEKITVSYSYQRMSGKVGHPEKMVNVVDLGLMNESGKFLGWSGSSRAARCPWRVTAGAARCAAWTRPAAGCT